MTLVATPEQQAWSEEMGRYLKEILERNNQRRFVRRILFPDNAPVVPDDEDPSRVMTHKMAWGEDDGQYYAFPTVMEGENGKLRNYGKGAFDEAIRRGEFIRFANPEDADWFSRNYKRYWDSIGYVPELRK